MYMMKGRAGIAVAAAALGLQFGCYDSTQRDDYDPGPDGPGTEAWGEVSIACNTDDDCNENEECLENVCQMRRCHNGPYNTEPPLGAELVFMLDQEVGVVDSNAYEDHYWIDRYSPSSSSASYDNSWKVTPSKILDVAGGNLREGRPEEIVAAIDGSSEVAILNSEGTTRFNVGFHPIAVATGDLDADGEDELMALSSTGVIAVCYPLTDECTSWTFDNNVVGLDLAVGDLDADGRAEVVALIEVDGSKQLVVANPDHEETGQQASYGLVAQDDDLARITAYDVDGDLVDEVVALNDPGCLVWCSADSLVVFRLDGANDAQLARWESPWDDLTDLDAGDLGADDTEELVVLDREDKKMIVLHMDDTLQFSTAFEAPMSVNSSADRIAIADYDGDSPSGRLVEGPKMCSGRPVPLFVAYYPPYWSEYSDTPANVYVGNSELTTETYSDTVSLHSSVELGVDADLLGVFKAGFSAKVAARVSKRVSQTHVQFVGNRVWTQARPDLYGPNYAAVLMSYVCTHAYTYELYDPANLTGQGTGKQFVLTVPVDGTAALMSSHRYNALAEALGGLPIVKVPHSIGDPTTYPTSMQSIEGGTIPEEDLVVPDPPHYMVSDVGYLGFSMSIWDYVGEETSAEIDVSVHAQGTVAGFKFGTEVGGGFGESHRIEVGREAVFGGNLPTLPDDPNTPEDEYAENAYSFAPIVYREHYEDINGEPAGYYVFHWMVGL